MRHSRLLYPSECGSNCSKIVALDGTFVAPLRLVALSRIPCSGTGTVHGVEEASAPPFQAEFDSGPVQTISDRFIVSGFNDASLIVFTGSSAVARMFASSLLGSELGVLVARLYSAALLARTDHARRRCLAAVAVLHGRTLCPSCPATSAVTVSALR
jgi:hypothetical protein